MIECYTRFFELPFRHNVLPLPGQATQLFGNVNLFNTGRAAVGILPPPGFRTYVQTKTVEFTIAPMPRVKISTPDMNMHMIGIVKDSRDTEEAWRFLQHLTDGSRFGKFVWRIPAETAQIQPWLKDALKDYADPRPHVVTSAVESAIPQVRTAPPAKSLEVVAAITAAFAEMWEQKVDPVAQLKALKPRLQSIVDQKT